jgi:hypothetical protein
VLFCKMTSLIRRKEEREEECIAECNIQPSLASLFVAHTACSHAETQIYQCRTPVWRHFPGEWHAGMCF